MSFRKAPTRVSATIGGKEIILETGRVATQAHGSVTIQCGGTVVLVTVCSQPLDFDRGFFPLTVEYSERMYAAGRIPGSFFRREIGRPSERETLVSRLIDRPIRPLFPKGLPEDVIIDALEWGRKEIQPLVEAQVKLRELAGKAKMAFTPQEDDAALLARIEELAAGAGLEAAMRVPEKMARKDARKLVKEKIVEALKADPTYGEDEKALSSVGDIIGHIEKKVVRKRILDEGTRIDGRDTKTVRPIEIQPGILPRAHGSALFTRGETQSLCVTTLGSSTDNQRMDSLTGDVTKTFMLHYNFPPFSVGEVKPVRVSRREIGHGALAEKALKPIIPAGDGFPFTVRVVAETLESNGSSSMAAVCGGCLSLMDAGVPISDPVAGVAMGLIKEGDNFIVLTDILGDEDALGDMDFKIAGTAEGVTAVQMDIKITGLTTEIMRKAMRQAHEARLHILGEMKKAIDGPRAELSKYAPQHAEVFVNPEVIRMIIGPGGKNIKAITAATGASVDIEDSGRISIFAPTAESMEQAKELVQYYDQRPDLGKNYMGKVRKVLEIGAIVEIMPNVEALVHISQLDTSRVAQASDVAHLGEDMLVKVIEINGDRIRASRKAVLLEEQGIEWKPEDTARPARAPRGEGDRDHRGDRGDRGERRERRPRRD